MKNYLFLLINLFIVASCTSQEKMTREIPDICYDNASLVWSVDGARQFDDTQLHARSVENWNEYFEVHINGAWRISLNSDEYEIYIEGNPFFSDSELEKISKDEWQTNYKIRGNYSFESNKVNTTTLSLIKKEGGTSRLLLQQTVSGQVQLGLEKQDNECEYILVNVNALFSNESNTTQQVEINLKAPYSFPN